VIALREFHRRLQIYPQFGDPLLDLHREQSSLWIGIVRPLCLRYGVLEGDRVVFVTSRPILLPIRRPES
jgi:hypothetical protein